VQRQTSNILDLLRRFESRNITFMVADGSWPIVWERAKGNFVWDLEGKRYLDLTAAFGVAAAGHANPRVVRAGQRQMATLLHAMGDVHPHALKAHLARELSRITFERWSRFERKASAAGTHRASWRRAVAVPHGKVIFCNSGFEAVEAALKTAMLATGKRGVLAFHGGYHGLGYGTLNATHRDHFRRPFLTQLGGFGRFVPFPTQPDELEPVEQSVRQLLRREPIGAVLVEPVQARGGINVPPPGFLAMLHQLCDEHGVLLVLDEIYTGFGRTGRWFACEHWGVVPDLICLGKALTGGFPLSACVGRADLMDTAWPPSAGEAIHTSTFLGHPVGCAMALSQIREIREKHLPERAQDLGNRLLARLSHLPAPAGLALKARGLGLLVGLEVREGGGAPATEVVMGVIKGMLNRGYILLPEGEHGNVISFTPPLTITEPQLDRTVSVLKDLLELSRSRTGAPTGREPRTR
jgi:4-aminobutyrate aminotransferase-like enzyme